VHEHWVLAPSIPFRSIHRLIQSVVSQLRFSFYQHGPVRTDFSGGQITSDAGLLPLRAFDERRRYTARLAEGFQDGRDPERIEHSLLELLRYRLYAIVAGYEDCNDAQLLRHDPIFQILADREWEQALSSQPTLSRWENAVRGRELVGLNDFLLDSFCSLYGRQVKRRGEIILDLDSTDDPTHGQQQLSLFNGHYGHTMYHPLLLWERSTGALLGVRLRRGNCVSYNRAVPFLRRLLRRLLAAFPRVRIFLRADAGFAVPSLYELLEEHGVHYVIRFTSHQFLRQRLARVEQRIRRRHQRSGQEQRFFTSLRHQAKVWSKARRLCVEVHCPDERLPVRFLITNLNWPAAEVCAFYNRRAECENRIDELKNGFSADRLSCHRFLSNALRLLLHAAAYNLVNAFRHSLPKAWRSLEIGSLRLRLFKLGARVRRTARCLWVHFASGWPHQIAFLKAARRFSSP
jgi:DDE family transposase